MGGGGEGLGIMPSSSGIRQTGKDVRRPRSKERRLRCGQECMHNMCTSRDTGSACLHVVALAGGDGAVLGGGLRRLSRPRRQAQHCVAGRPSEQGFRQAARAGPFMVAVVATFHPAPASDNWQSLGSERRPSSSMHRLGCRHPAEQLGARPAAPPAGPSRQRRAPAARPAASTARR